MTNTDYTLRAKEAGSNIYFVSEGDKDYNIRTQCITPANPCCNCYSIAKAFTVTAIGMLYDRGMLTPRMRLVDLLGDKLPLSADESWSEVTLHDLMLHKAGFDRGMLDIDAEDASEYPSDDYLEMVLSTKLKYKPGTVFQYTDAAYYLLSRVIESVSGIDTADLLRPALMKTMKFKELSWSVCPRGYSMGATGLYLRTEDVVKLGILYLNRGVWMGERIISEEWVDIVLENGYEFKSVGDGWYRKGGMRGQMLAFNVDSGIALAWHSFDEKVSFDAMISR